VRADRSFQSPFTRFLSNPGVDMDQGHETVHPDPAILALFAAGQLRDGEMERLEKHLASCQACLEVLEQVPEDAMVRMLRDYQRHATESIEQKDGEPTPGEETDPPIDGISPSSWSEGQDPTGSFSPAGEGSVHRLSRELTDHPRYRARSRLGQGGMGFVFLAEDRVENRPVVLKFLREDLLDQPRLVERFRREVEAATQLKHPNIVEAWGAEQFGRWPALVMEYVNGTNLARMVERTGPVPVAVACELIRQAALGLEYSFAQGTVHRDIKPANLMVTPDGRLKILDFGLAKMQSELSSEPGLTSTGALLGSIDYMAPEQADDPRVADIRADIYSLGCTFYTLLAGHPPFPTGSLWDRIQAHARSRHRPLPSIRSDVPVALAAAVDRMLAKSPSLRPSTPADVVLSLAPFADAVDRGGQFLDVPVLNSAPWDPSNSDLGPTAAECGEEEVSATVIPDGFTGSRAIVRVLAVGFGVCLILGAILKILGMILEAVSSTPPETNQPLAAVKAFNPTPLGTNEVPPDPNHRSHVLLRVVSPTRSETNQPLAADVLYGTNLLSNGSFEDGPAVNGFLPLDAGSMAIPGWKVTRGQIDYVDNLEDAGGKRSLDLHGSPGYGGVEQTFRTANGQRYVVTFRLAGSPNCFFPNKRVVVAAAGESQEFAFDSTGKTPDKMGWVKKEWEFDAVADQTTLEIRTLEDRDPFKGPALDDVSVVAVPRTKQ
jgi:choice-of-anchor C domain-containing protein